MPGTYVDKNCNSNKIYVWARNNGGMGAAQMNLSEEINGTYFDVLSDAQGNYEAPDATEGSVLIRIVLKRRISLSQC